MREDNLFSTHLEPNTGPRSIRLAAPKSWDMDNPLPGYNSLLSTERDIVVSDEVVRSASSARNSASAIIPPGKGTYHVPPDTAGVLNTG